jgi:DNA-binding MarR family transcriptional regulator
MTSGGATDSPRWLDDDELAAWTALVKVLLRLPGALDRQLRSDSGLTHTQYSVLAMLSTSQSGIPMTELAVATSVEASRLSHLVRVLEEQGLVTRTSGLDDRRVQIARITSDGAAVLRGAAPGHVELVRDLVVDRLTPSDLRDLRRIAAKVLCALDDAGPISPSQQ